MDLRTVVIKFIFTAVSWACHHIGDFFFEGGGGGIGGVHFLVEMSGSYPEWTPVNLGVQ